MKILFFLLLGVTLSEQSFWFERAKPTTINKIIEIEPTDSVLSSSDTHRYIVNVLSYKVENETEGATEFACLGTLITNDYAVVPADCVSLKDPYKYAIQFVINKDDTNDVGPSIILKNTQVEIHPNYTYKNNETHNVALVKFSSQGISVNPPIFEHFAPIERSALPSLNYCSVIGPKIFLSTLPEEKVLVNGPGCCGTSQAYCTVFENMNHEACKALHGAPVVCNGKFAGFVLKTNVTCTPSAGRILLKYHSVDTFKDFINYYADGLTTTTPAPEPDSATSIKLSISVLIFFVTLIILK